MCHISHPACQPYLLFVLAVAPEVLQRDFLLEGVLITALLWEDSCSSSSDHRAGPAIRFYLFLHINNSKPLSCCSLLVALQLGPASDATICLSFLTCFNCCLSDHHPVYLVVDARFYEIVVVHFQQKSAVLKYVVYVCFSKLVYLFRDVMQLFSSQPPVLLVVECEVPEDPLAVRYVQNFADELSNPLFSINLMIYQDDMLILDVRSVWRFFLR